MYPLFLQGCISWKVLVTYRLYELYEKHGPLFNFQRILCKKESEEVCKLIWTKFDGFTIHTIFPLISVPSAYYILKLREVTLIRGSCYLKGGAYFKVSKRNKIKCQSLVTFSFKIFTMNKPNIMKKSKYQQYLYRFIVYILISYAFFGLVTSRI